VIAARLSHAAESGDAAFAFLQGVRDDAFGAACGDLSPSVLDAVLRFAPARLRSAALERLSAEQRHKLAVSWATRPEVPVTQAVAAAEELRERLARIGGGPLQAQRALADLVEALPRAEQDVLVEKIRRETGTLPVAFLTESALFTAPADAASAAVLGVPVATVATYLSAAEPDLRERVLSICPARLRRELEEELQVRAAASRGDFQDARRELLSRLRDEIGRRSAGSPSPLNGGAQVTERPAASRLVSA
jgi:flagellar motor switch protein FliG